MDFKTFLLIIIGSALANNVVLEQFFGVTPALGAKGSAKRRLQSTALPSRRSRSSQRSALPVSASVCIRPLSLLSGC